MLSRLPSLLGISGVFLLCACGPDLPDDVAAAYEALPAELDYNIHVRPILSDRCWSCHGPDERSRMADLRLDQAASAFAKTDRGAVAIAPGKPGSSELVNRILSHDPEYVMPTPESNLSLTAQEKATLVRWIEDGAQFDPHWAFVPLPPIAEAEPLAPDVLDGFVHAAQKRQGLAANERAEPRELVRRVYRDLTGLPPTYAQTRAFVDDPSEEHYASIVDSLLTTDAHAERMTLEWMDLARYADSHGLHADGIRTSWPWRDWVIDAFRQNMSYRQFVTEQLAGDLMPEATRDQILATAFNRNHVMTGEGGAADEEFRMTYVMDRANTFATAFLGLTMECAACHDHKFDPVSQKEYYQLTAFFNNVKELGMTGDDGDFGPVISLPDSATEAKLHRIDAQIAQLDNQMSDAGLAQTIAFIESLPSVPKPLAYLPLDEVGGKHADGYPRSPIVDTVFTVAGKVGQAYYLDTEWDAVDIPIQPFEAYDAFTMSLWVKTDKREDGKWQALLVNSGDKNGHWRGINLELMPDNRLNLRVTHTLPGHYLELISEDSVRLGEWTHVAASYDGSLSAAGMRLYLDGRPAAARIGHDKLYKSVYPLNNDMTMTPEARPFRLGVSHRHYRGEVGNFRGAVDEVYVFGDQLSAREVATVAARGGASIEPGPDAEADHCRVEAWRKRAPELRRLRKERVETLADAPDVMVMADESEARPAYVLERGNWDQHGERVSYGTPASVGTFDVERFESNRLGLAKWLFDEANPLSARVAVNRYWQMIMGRGLVATSHDFGMQGELPSHPRLLDYLANGFRASDYDLRELLRTIANSETYKASARIDPAQLEQDPDNVYLTRAANLRYPAEFIRDYALAVSGLLVDSVGGPSVHPYQPDGLWLEKSSFSMALYEYHEDEGDDLHRRSMYTFLRRTSPPPAMLALDMPSRDRCYVAREQTNTPLQALVLLNDPQFVEAARVLAQAVDAVGERSAREGVEEAFRRVLGREPNERESTALVEIYEDATASFGASRKDALALLQVGEYPLPRRYDAAHLASLTTATNVLLNHDEVYTRR